MSGTQRLWGTQEAPSNLFALICVDKTEHLGAMQGAWCGSYVVRKSCPQNCPIVRSDPPGRSVTRQPCGCIHRRDGMIFQCRSRQFSRDADAALLISSSSEHSDTCSLTGNISGHRATSCNEDEGFQDKGKSLPLLSVLLPCLIPHSQFETNTSAVDGTPSHFYCVPRSPPPPPHQLSLCAVAGCLRRNCRKGIKCLLTGSGSVRAPETTHIYLPHKYGTKNPRHRLRLTRLSLTWEFRLTRSFPGVGQIYLSLCHNTNLTIDDVALNVASISRPQISGKWDSEC